MRQRDGSPSPNRNNNSNDAMAAATFLQTHASGYTTAWYLPPPWDTWRTRRRSKNANARRRSKAPGPGRTELARAATSCCSLRSTRDARVVTSDGATGGGGPLLLRPHAVNTQGPAPQSRTLLKGRLRAAVNHVHAPARQIAWPTAALWRTTQDIWCYHTCSRPTPLRVWHHRDQRGLRGRQGHPGFETGSLQTH